jgi:hypothetical protein
MVATFFWLSGSYWFQISGLSVSQPEALFFSEKFVREKRRWNHQANKPKQGKSKLGTVQREKISEW